MFSNAVSQQLTGNTYGNRISLLVRCTAHFMEKTEKSNKISKSHGLGAASKFSMHASSGISERPSAFLAVDHSIVSWFIGRVLACNPPKEPSVPVPKLIRSVEASEVINLPGRRTLAVQTCEINLSFPVGVAKLSDTSVGWLQEEADRK